MNHTWSVVAKVQSGRLTRRPAVRRPSNACCLPQLSASAKDSTPGHVARTGEVTSWTRCLSTAIISQDMNPEAWSCTYRCRARWCHRVSRRRCVLGRPCHRGSGAFSQRTASCTGAGCGRLIAGGSSRCGGRLPIEAGGHKTKKMPEALTIALL